MRTELLFCNSPLHKRKTQANGPVLSVWRYYGKLWELDKDIDHYEGRGSARKKFFNKSQAYNVVWKIARSLLVYVWRSLCLNFKSATLLISINKVSLSLLVNGIILIFILLYLFSYFVFINANFICKPGQI